ncbi:DUF3413 domain-containing protein [Marinobacter sp.]|uniref:DUF3413 domain-containing protein n=1 Tax=Marinobacter sp. TaxID=50741 RepID=UPI003A908FA9
MQNRKASHNSGSHPNWVAWFIFANGILCLLVGLRFLPWMTVADATTAIYVGLLMPGQFVLLAWLAGIPLLLASFALPKRLLTILAVTYGSLGVAVLLIDTVAYSLYRFHLSGFVLELAVEAGTEVFSFSGQLWGISLGIFVVILLVESFFAALLWRVRPSAKWLMGAFATMLALQLGAHSWHAWADANYDSRITSITRHIPLYYGATAKRLMQRYDLIDQQQARKTKASQSLAKTAPEGALNYPTQPLVCSQPEQSFNVLIIVLDGARWDMLAPEWTPNIYEFARDSLVFEQHYSNGNATKPGIFTLFYSLPASYWNAFTAAKEPPVAISRMQQLGYQTKVLGSATLISPAFDQNVFSSIPNLRLHTPGDEAWDRDIKITDDWLAFTSSERRADDPFFGFLFYDTTHNHVVPDDYPVKFQPYWQSVNKLALDQDFNPELIKNNYKSTLHFVDNQVGRVLDDLRSKQLLDKTVVMITGDHGQEFNEYEKNYWGHGSNFGEYQLRVPMVVHWTGKAAAHIKYRTENFDIAPTLMTEVLGCEASPVATYATGNSLFNKRQRDWSIAHSYMDQALLLDGLSIVSNPSGDVDVFDRNLQPVADYVLSPDIVKQVLNELSRFYE